jgi:hypothetical protein
VRERDRQRERKTERHRERGRETSRTAFFYDGEEEARRAPWVIPE